MMSSRFLLNDTGTAGLPVSIDSVKSRRRSRKQCGSVGAPKTSKDKKHESNKR